MIYKFNRIVSTRPFRTIVCAEFWRPIQSRQRPRPIARQSPPESERSGNGIRYWNYVNRFQIRSRIEYFPLRGLIFDYIIKSLPRILHKLLQLTLLVRSRWNTPASWTYCMPLAIPIAKRTFTDGQSVFPDWISCSSDPPLMYSVNACNWPSWTQTPMKLK